MYSEWHILFYNNNSIIREIFWKRHPLPYSSITYWHKRHLTNICKKQTSKQYLLITLPKRIDIQYFVSPSRLKMVKKNSHSTGLWRVGAHYVCKTSAQSVDTMMHHDSASPSFSHRHPSSSPTLSHFQGWRRLNVFTLS